MARCVAGPMPSKKHYRAVDCAQNLVAAACCARNLRSVFALLALLKRGAERRKAQGLARPPGAVACGPGHACEACPSPLAIGDPRLSALHHGVFVKPSPTH